MVPNLGCHSDNFLVVLNDNLDNFLDDNHKVVIVTIRLTTFRQLFVLCVVGTANFQQLHFLMQFLYSDCHVSSKAWRNSNNRSALQLGTNYGAFLDLDFEISDLELGGLDIVMLRHDIMRCDAHRDVTAWYFVTLRPWRHLTSINFPVVCVTESSRSLHCWGRLWKKTPNLKFQGPAPGGGGTIWPYMDILSEDATKNTKLQTLNFKI